MLATIPANQLPPIVVPSIPNYVADANNTTANGLLPGVIGLNTSNYGGTWSNLFNQNAQIAALLSRHGGGGYAICQVNPSDTSFNLVAPASGLSLTVKRGQAILDGIVETISDQTVSINDNTARTWIWLTANGALVAVPNSAWPTTIAAPPAGNCLLIGSCVTSGGNITSVDVSGVFYKRGGVMLRQTADIAIPADNPPSTLFFITTTKTGIYIWDGTNYHSVTATISTNRDVIPVGESDIVPYQTNVIELSPVLDYGSIAIYGRMRVIL